MMILRHSERSTRRLWSRTAALVVMLLLPAGVLAEEAPELGEPFDAFYGVGLASEGVQLQDFTLRRPDARIVLQSGIFLPAEPIAGIVTGGVFLGHGSLSFRPSQKMDRKVLSVRMQEWLKRNGEEYKGEFDGLFLRFSDRTWEEMQKAGTPASGDAQEAEKIWRDRNGQLDVITSLGLFAFRPFNLEMDFLEKTLNQLDDHSFFLAEVNAGSDGWLTYSYNENDIHEIFFGNHRPLGATVEVHPFTVTSVAGNYDSSGNYVVEPEDDDKQTLDTEHYRMVVTIPNTVHVLVEAAVEFVPRVPVKVVRFDLINNISRGTVVPWTDRGSPVDVTSVTDGEGKPLPYIHRRHQILVQYPEPLPAGETAVLAIGADESTIVQLLPESYQLLNTYPWFPQHGFAGGRNTHEWTVKINRPLTAAVSGRLVKEWEEEGLDCTGWVMTEPVQFPSLIFGLFRSDKDAYKSKVSGNEVELRVYAIPHGQTEEGISYSGLKRMQPVLDEAKVILGLYEQLFGPYPYDYLNVAQMAIGMGFGQAPPGLVQLTGEAFMSPSILASLSDIKGDFFHEFFAHELAHQWWAHAVWGTSFRDTWLSESFAEYAAGLYVVQLQGEARFQQKIKEWRQNARQAEGRAPLASLMSLGGDMAGAYYQDLIYNKGPYVVHMLRMQMGHDKWVEAMQRFFSKHMNENLTTEALMAEMEQSVGYKLDFFFDQWWKGMNTPVFDFSYEIEPTEDGRFLFTGTIRQEGDPVKVLMPVFFHFGGKKVTMEQRPILQAVDVYKAILPERPKKVSLDDYNTLLADIRQQ